MSLKLFTLWLSNFLICIVAFINLLSTFLIIESYQYASDSSGFEGWVS
jgi:hypothetical protein